jgi:hypothetical protein
MTAGMPYGNKMSLSSSKFGFRFGSLLNQIKHAKEFRSIKQQIAIAETRLEEDKQRLAHVLGHNAKRLYTLGMYKHAEHYLNRAIEVLAADSTEIDYSEELLVLLSNLVRLYKLHGAFEKAFDVMVSISTLQEELLKEKQRHLMSKNWELRFKDESLLAKDQVIDEKEAVLFEMNKIIEKKKQELKRKNSLLENKKKLLKNKDQLLEDYRNEVKSIEVNSIKKYQRKGTQNRGDNLDSLDNPISAK